MNKGILELITGPMFAGKTSALLKKARNFEGQVALIKPSFDVRYGICEIKTHDGVAATAFNLSNTQEILNSLEKEKARVAFFDEIQFFTEPHFQGDILACIDTLLSRGISVVCCGLDLNWKAEPFEIVAKLKVKANRCTVVCARCAVCNEPAMYTYKQGGSELSIELGAEDIYEPRCAKHYPFSPEYQNGDKQNELDDKQGELFDF